MKLQNLSIKNYRGIKELNLDFDGTSAIFFGENGTGKSSVLKSIAALFFPVIETVVPEANEAISISDSDININGAQTELSFIININGRELPFSLSKDISGDTRKKEMNELQIKEIVNCFFKQYPEGTPLILNYSVYRSLGAQKTNSYNDTHYELDDTKNAYINCLDPNAYFGDFFDWYKNQEDIENQFIREDRNYVDKTLESVRKAIYNFLPDISNIRISRTRRYATMLFTKKGHNLNIQQLSDGEKVLIALIGDISRRLTQANPHAQNPIHSEAIILIDEIELHLHPKWQRSIIHNLKATFPNVQFILSTHSPQVLGELKNEINIFKFSKEKNLTLCEQVESTFGRDSNYILEQFMDTKKANESVSEQLSQLFRFIALKDYTEAKQLYEQLAIILTKQNPELVRAEILIRRGIFKK
jgi:predicted ATP-binding protein involved in virulence